MNKKAIALIILGLVLLVAIIYFIFFYNFSGSNNEQTNTPAQNQTAEPVVSKSSPKEASGEPVSAQEQSKTVAEKLAILFSERYGSSSNQSNFANLIDSEVFMTDAMKKRTEEYINKERAKAQANPEYEGITTKAIVANFSTFNETAGTAEVLVKTKRQKTNSKNEVSVYEQDLSLVLKKFDNDWKVDDANWK